MRQVEPLGLFRAGCGRGHRHLYLHGLRRGARLAECCQKSQAGSFLVTTYEIRDDPDDLPVDLDEDCLEGEVELARRESHRPGDEGAGARVVGDDVAGAVRDHLARRADADLAAARLHAAEADLFAFGRPFISNPDLPLRLRTGAAIAMRVCIVIKVDEGGQITRIDEYFDPAEIRPLL